MEETPMKLLCALANRAALPRQLDHTVVPGEARSSIRHLPDADPLSSAPPLDLRRHMIAEAAYFRAERRGFCGGDSERLDDWLQAEMEIGRLLATECETEVVG